MVETATAEDVKRSIERDAATVVDVLAAAHDDEHVLGTIDVPYDEAGDRFPEEFDGRTHRLLPGRELPGQPGDGGDPGWDGLRERPRLRGGNRRLEGARLRDHERELIVSAAGPPSPWRIRTCTHDTDTYPVSTGHGSGFGGIT
jgi:hypothetical protein